jgi:2-polyprenyl-6-methoxyphenol hydroxylase-like FAD-dependent oxidoreductase
LGKVCDNSSWDVTVVGGGLAGASFARAISGAGLRTLVLDHLAQDTLYTNELDNRGLAISYTSKQILQQLACWDYFVSRAFPIETNLPLVRIR